MGFGLWFAVWIIGKFDDGSEPGSLDSTNVDEIRSLLVDTVTLIWHETLRTAVQVCSNNALLTLCLHFYGFVTIHLQRIQY